MSLHITLEEVAFLAIIGTLKSSLVALIVIPVAWNSTAQTPPQITSEKGGYEPDLYRCMTCVVVLGNL